MKNIAPSWFRAVSTVHTLRSKPGEAEIAVVPSVAPMVSHESNSAVAMTGNSAGFTPPMLTPNGVATWKAAGICIGAPDSPARAYTFLCALLSITPRRTVDMPSTLVAIVVTVHSISMLPLVELVSFKLRFSHILPS